MLLHNVNTLHDNTVILAHNFFDEPLLARIAARNDLDLITFENAPRCDEIFRLDSAGFVKQPRSSGSSVLRRHAASQLESALRGGLPASSTCKRPGQLPAARPPGSRRGGTRACTVCPFCNFDRIVRNVCIRMLKRCSESSDRQRGPLIVTFF